MATPAPAPAPAPPPQAAPQGEPLEWNAAFGSPVGSPVADDQNVYTLAIAPDPTNDERYGTVRVVQIDKTGATSPRALATFPHTFVVNMRLGDCQLGVAGGQVVFGLGESTGVASVPIGGGRVVPGPDVGGFVADGQAIYYFDAGVVRLPVPFDPSHLTRLASFPSGNAFGPILAVSGGALAFVTADATGLPDEEAASTSLSVMTGEGTAATPITSGRMISGLAVDADRVYWIEYGGTVKSAPLGGGGSPMPMTLATVDRDATALTVAGTRICWEDDQGVRCVSKTGGDVQTVIPDDSLARGAAAMRWTADAEAAYFNAGEVRRVPFVPAGTR